MLQPSQVPTYILFLGFIVLLIAIFLWAMQKGISNIQKLPDLTDIEAAVIRRQMLALTVGTPLFILFLFLSPLGWNLGKPIPFFVALIIGFAPLLYISISSIRNRVSILRGREPHAVKGAKAVWNGAMNLAFISLAFIVFAIYFFR